MPVTNYSYPMLLPEIDSELVSIANEKAQVFCIKSLPELRKNLGKFTQYPYLHNTKNIIDENLTGNELVHCSYFSHTGVIRIMELWSIVVFETC